MNKPFFHIAFFILLTVVGESMGQTKIAVPTTTIHFDDMKVPKSQRVSTRKLRTLKQKKVKELGRLVKRHTYLDDNRLNTYQLVFQSMDTSELDQIHQELDQFRQLDINQPSPFLEETYQLDRIDKNREFEFADERDFLESMEKISLDSSKFKSLLEIKNDSILKVNSLAQFDNRTEMYYNQIDSFRIDSTQIRNLQMPADSIIAERIEMRLESLVKDKIAGESFTGLEDPIAEPRTLVQHYVPNLETFKYKKPEIPEDKLSEALLEQYKERKKQELIDQLNPAENEKQNSSNTLSKFSIGGFARYDATKNSIELTPVITYSPLRKINLGVGYQTNISLSGSDSLNTTGIRTFVQYTFYQNYYLHGESEWIERSSDTEGQSKKERNTYLGLGRNFRYKFINTSITALYNFNAPTELRSKKFTIRLGITINK